MINRYLLMNIKFCHKLQTHIKIFMKLHLIILFDFINNSLCETLK